MENQNTKIIHLSNRGYNRLNEELVPAITLSDSVLRRLNTSKTSLKYISDRLGIDITQLFYNPKGLIHSFCYWDGIFYYDFLTLQEDFLFDDFGDTTSSFGIEEQFQTMKKMMYDMIRIGDYIGAVHYADEKARLPIYKALRHNLSIEEQKEIEILVLSEEIILEHEMERHAFAS